MPDPSPTLPAPQRRPYQSPRLEVCAFDRPRAIDKTTDAATNCSDHLHNVDGFAGC